MVVEKLTVGIYESSSAPSGPSRYVESLVAGIDPEEFEIVLFCRRGGPYRQRPGVQLAYVQEEDGFRGTSGDDSPRGDRELPQILRRGWRRFAPDSLKLWTGFGRECLRLARRFRERPVDLLHTSNTGCEESAIAARLAGVPKILGTFHVDPTSDTCLARSGPGHRVLECLSNHSLHRAIAVSEATKTDWVRRTFLAGGRVLTIPNGVDPDQFPRGDQPRTARRGVGMPPDAQPVIGGAGRLVEAKGFSYLLEALALLSGDYPALTLVLAGDGPMRESLRKQASALGIADRVHFIGFCGDIQRFYNALDVFVLSSICDALPYVVLEAMAAELPVVGTSVGGVPEIIVSGGTGILVPPRDPCGMAAALRPLLDSPALRRRMGHAGRERVAQHFNTTTAVPRTIEVYRDMLRDVTPRRRERNPHPAFSGAGS